MLINAPVVHVFLYITIILHNLVICLFPASIVPVADLLMGKFNIVCSSNVWCCKVWRCDFRFWPKNFKCMYFLYITFRFTNFWRTSLLRMTFWRIILWCMTFCRLNVWLSLSDPCLSDAWLSCVWLSDVWFYDVCIFVVCIFDVWLSDPCLQNADRSGLHLHVTIIMCH